MNKKLSILLVLFLSCCAVNREYSLYNQMEKNDVDIALIANCGGIEKYPIWSSDSRFVAARILGNWIKFDLLDVTLSQGFWRNQNIAIVSEIYSSEVDLSDENFHNSTINNSQITIHGFDHLTRYKARRYSLKVDTNDFSTPLILTNKDGKTKIIRKDNLAGCHSLSKSPDNNFVAFICENKLFLMKAKDY